MNKSTAMQLAIPSPPHRFDYFCTMNRSDTLHFSEELPFPTISNNDTVIKEQDHGDVRLPPIVQMPQEDLNSANYKPTGRDIICGRGRGSFLHEGNKVYLSLLRKNIDTYLAATKRMEKGVIIKTAVSSLKERGFRFLKQDEKNQRWYELSDAECYDRTAHAIRDLIRKKKGRNTAKRDPKTSEKTEHRHSERLKAIPPPDQTSSANIAVDLNIIFNQPTENEDSFDQLIRQIPPEVMSPTGTLTTSGFEIFFEMDPDDFGRMLTQVDTEKQRQRDSRMSH